MYNVLLILDSLLTVINLPLYFYIVHITKDSDHWEKFKEAIKKQQEAGKLNANNPFDMYPESAIIQAVKILRTFLAICALLGITFLAAGISLLMI